MRQGIQEDALRIMLEGGAVREVLVSRHGDKWGLAVRLGGRRRKVALAVGGDAPTGGERIVHGW